MSFSLTQSRPSSLALFSIGLLYDVDPSCYQADECADLQKETETPNIADSVRERKRPVIFCLGYGI